MISLSGHEIGFYFILLLVAMLVKVKWAVRVVMVQIVINSSLKLIFQLKEERTKIV